jgi:hypothetical protein
MDDAERMGRIQGLSKFGSLDGMQRTADSGPSACMTASRLGTSMNIP